MSSQIHYCPCGFHVHVPAQDPDSRSVANRLSEHEQVEMMQTIIAEHTATCERQQIARVMPGQQDAWVWFWEGK